MMGINGINNITAGVNVYFLLLCLHSMEGVINGPSVDKISTLVQSGQLIQRLNFWPSSIYNLAICMTLLLISPLKPASCYQEILKTGKKDTNNIVALTKWIVIRKCVRLRLKA